MTIEEGQTYGRLTVVRRISPAEAPGSSHEAWWACVCSCGKTKQAKASRLRSGKLKSCGCLAAERRVLRAAGVNSQHPLYQTWRNMLHRCENPKAHAYDRYGGRGITVCDKWQTFSGFLEDMGPRPSPKHTLDRIDNDGPYSPENVRWATAAEQANNRGAGRRVRMDGESVDAAEAARRLGMTEAALRSLTRLSLQQVVDRLVRSRAPREA